MARINTPTLIVIAVVLTILAGFVLSLSANEKREKILDITNFDECKSAGYPIMESYPEQCRTPDGRLFVNERQYVPATSDDDVQIDLNGELPQAI